MHPPSRSGPPIARLMRVVYACAAGAAAFAATTVALAGAALPAGWREISTAAFALLGLACLWAASSSPGAARRAMLPLTLVGLVVVGAHALVSGDGLRAPGLIVFGLVCCAAGSVARRGQGVAVTAVAAAVLVTLAAAEWQGVVPGAAAEGVLPLALGLVLHLGTVAAGAGIGAALRRVSIDSSRAANDREQRFRDLLGIATEAYWETDAELRVTQVSRREAVSGFVEVPIGEPVAPWDYSSPGVDEDLLDHLRAEMEAREPVRDVPLRLTGNGREQRLLISAAPRFDAAGRFVGYWGVARDVTAEHLARTALLDTELRYHDLFMCTPTPLVIHRQGMVLDANQAAATMFGFSSAVQLRGHHLSEFYLEEELGQLTERLHQLDAVELGQALPPADFHLVARDGRQLSVRGTGVRTEFGGRPAVLSIYIDETHRRAADAARQRTETLLRRVIELSPDMIVLAEFESGRYEMVNESFSRITGWPAQDAVGRTALELGLYSTEEDRERLTGLLKSQGAVKDIAITLRHRDGHRLPMLVSAARFVSEERTYIVSSGRDMTDANRDRLEREAIMANASVGLAHTRDRRFVMVNPRFEQMYGWPPGTLVGQPGRVVWCSDEDYAALAEQIGPALRRGEQVEIEREASRHDGSRFLARLRAKAIDPQHPGSGGTIWIAEDVTAQRQAEQELARARDAAEAANRAKSAFLANTSHEIRTPLNGLVGLARMARQPDVEPQRLHHYLEQIGASAETLSMIISDILDLSKIEAGRLELESAPFDLHEMLVSLHRAYSSLADSRGLALTLELDPSLTATVQGDALRVRQILVNYLHNALKFTAQGTVALTARPLDGERVRFEVSDTGPGIDEATQARLFAPFTQADESITRRYGGTGLGLSICRELAHLMGGRVGVVSAPGEGSCFYAELPLPPAAGALACAGEAAAGDRPLEGVRALLVEDNPVNMMIAVAMLEAWGVEVEQAEDGVQALRAVDLANSEGRRYDVVLMDVQMPGMSGHEVTRRLRERYSCTQLPVIALTAAALVSERDTALAAGMNDFVTKPIETDRLRQALQRTLAAAPA